jgi:hypothetical protein
MKFRGQVLERWKSPGPAQYLTVRDINNPKKGVGIGTSNRIDLAGSPSKAEEPGPGSYDLASIRSSLAFSVGRSQRIHKNNANPGPGHYKLPCYVSDTPQYILQQHPDFKFV